MARNVKRAIGYILFTAILLFVIIVVLLRIDAVRQRRKAEALRQAVLSLRPGKATLVALRRVVNDYGHPDSYVDKCDESECHVSLVAYSFSFPRPMFNNSFLRILGIRPVSYSAGFDLIDGVVVRSEFSVFYQRPDGSWLRAGMHILDSFTREDQCVSPDLRHHPEYAVMLGADGKQRIGIFIRAGVTANANPEELRHATAINLGCVNSLHNCSIEELMPLAYQDWLADKKSDKSSEGLLTKAQCDQAAAVGSASIPWWVVGERRRPL